MTTIVTAREAGNRLGLAHLEVIRRIRRGDIVAQKLGWNWIVSSEEVEAVREKEWYTKLMKRRSAA